MGTNLAGQPLVGLDGTGGRGSDDVRGADAGGNVIRVASFGSASDTAPPTGDSGAGSKPIDRGDLDQVLTHPTPEVLLGFADAAFLTNHLHEADSFYRRTLDIVENDSEGFRSAVHGKLGDCCQSLGRDAEARRNYEQSSYALTPARIPQKMRAIGYCPVVFEKCRDITIFREDLMDRLLKIERFWEPEIDLDYLPYSNCHPSFNLQFHDCDERPLREAYARIFAPRFERYQKPADWKNDGKPKLGFVLATDATLQPFLKNLSPLLLRFSDQVEVTVIAWAGVCEQLKSLPFRFLPLPRPFAEQVETIRAEKFDLLYFREIGVNSFSYFLPYFRMAPVQVTSFGIQVTSGIQNVDYYLSSKLVEPEGAQADYTERLVLLDSLMVCRQRPKLDAPTVTREVLGLSDRDHIYLLAQQVGKLHPAFDPVLREILERDERGVLLVANNATEAHLAQLKRRWRTTLGPTLSRVRRVHCEGADYLSLFAIANVSLDPPAFGGMNSTWDALAMGCPIVTSEGRWHRQRYAAGCNRKMGLPMSVSPIVVADRAEYAAAAQAVAEHRKGPTPRHAASDPLFNDYRAATELEETLTKLAYEGRK